MNHSRILILMSDTGGGHRASAQALQAAFAARYPDRFQVEIVDLWTDYTPWPINQMPRLYSPIIARVLWFWKLLWAVFENERAFSAALRLVYLISRKELRRVLQAHRPQLIISVHPFMQHIFLRLLEQECTPIPFVTVVTDLASFHHGWFHARVERCFVASEVAAATARCHGLHGRQVRLLGLPVRPPFAGALPQKETARARLGLMDNAFTVLLLGGGEGMGPVAATAHAVARRLATTEADCQLVVICGRNERLRKALQRSDWPIPVQICGFVDNMQEWMAASDCVITKAGPGTIAEALICGLPILLSGFIPGQEEGNVGYVVENGVGAYCDSPEDIAATINDWAGDNKLLQMAARARELARPRAAYDIVDEIVALLDGEAVEE
ncbi:MAG: glycosyltransferase [Caldilineaceae bacterium]|nr:glycosyltransferase [Caldilineaceae bacterium]